MNITPIGMILLSLDSSHHDESNGSKTIPIGAIFVEIALSNNFCKNFGSGRVGYPNHRVKFGALVTDIHVPLNVPFHRNSQTDVIFQPGPSVLR